MAAFAGVERAARPGVERPLGDLRPDAGVAGVSEAVLEASGVMPSLYLSFSSLLVRPEKISLNSGSLRIFAHAPVARFGFWYTCGLLRWRLVGG